MSATERWEGSARAVNVGLRGGDSQDGVGSGAVSGIARPVLDEAWIRPAWGRCPGPQASRR